MHLLGPLPHLFCLFVVFILRYSVCLFHLFSKLFACLKCDFFITVVKQLFYKCKLYCNLQAHVCAYLTFFLYYILYYKNNSFRVQLFHITTDRHTQN